MDKVNLIIGLEFLILDWLIKYFVMDWRWFLLSMWMCGVKENCFILYGRNFLLKCFFRFKNSKYMYFYEECLYSIML